MTDDEKYMARCIQLARNGEAGAPPNPMVGAVIVARGRIIGEGWHRQCGGPHAEVNAIGSVREADRPLLREATIYVSLEPCSHWGRTPPCADLIVRHGIPRVVCGCQDPFAEVQGRGIQRLRDAGCDVVVGVLEAECKWLNRRFITMHTQHRPWVTLKWAQSADGFIDRPRTSRADGLPVRFSDAYTQTLVHRLRATHQAILVGRRTFELDAPSLTTRWWPGPSAQRCLLSRTVAAQSAAERPAPFDRLEADGWLVYGSVTECLTDLYRRNLQSLLVEGGAQTLQAFIDADIWDEAYVERTGQEVHEGVPAPSITPNGRPLHVNFT